VPGLKSLAIEGLQQIIHRVHLESAQGELIVRRDKYHGRHQLGANFRQLRRQSFGCVVIRNPQLLLKQNVEWINDLLSFERIKRQGYFNPTVVEGLKTRYSKPGFKLNFPFESDFLNVVLTHGIFLELFRMPNFG